MRWNRSWGLGEGRRARSTRANEEQLMLAIARDEIHNLACSHGRSLITCARMYPPSTVATKSLPVPSGFLLISDAVDILAQGMWGACRRPHPVVAYKQDRAFRDDSVGFGPWKEKAAKRLRASAIAGKLQVYAIANLRQPAETTTLVVPKIYDVQMASVPSSVLKRLITCRGGFPNQVLRPTIKTTGGDEGLLALLNRGAALLAFREQEFHKWYRFERAKGRWPSQKSKRQPSGGGRPSKHSEELTNVIARLVGKGSWQAKDGIPKLRRILVESGYADIPSIDTLRRLVMSMFVETGDPALRRFRQPTGVRIAEGRAKTGKTCARSRDPRRAFKSL
jgi:hypothetical protein